MDTALVRQGVIRILTAESRHINVLQVEVGMDCANQGAIKILNVQKARNALQVETVMECANRDVIKIVNVISMKNVLHLAVDMVHANQDAKMIPSVQKKEGLVRLQEMDMELVFDCSVES